MKLTKALGVFAVSFTLTASCSGLKHAGIQDPELNLTRQDYLDLRSPKPASTAAPRETGPPIPDLKVEPPQISLKAGQAASGPPVPDLAEIIAAPEPPKIGQTKVVSVSVTDDVPLKDILIELARLADVDVEIDSSITGGITFRAKDRPFNEVIDRIASMAGLRYTMKNGVLRIERDLPYVQTYALDMLNIDRQTTGTLNTTSGGGESSGGAGGGDSGGSKSTLTAASKGDFWDKFQESVKQILDYKPTSMSVNAGAAGGASESFFTLNRQAGTLTFSGTERQHAVLRNFLKAIEGNISSQVLIEAKIVEVTLNDHFQSGIDWTKLGGDSISFASDLNPVSAASSAITPATITVLKNNVLHSGSDLSFAVSLLDEFGTSRALSSPRLNAMNNQQAVLSFTENIVYFDVKITVTDAVAGTGGSATTPAKVDVTSTPKYAPVGIVLTIQPTINKDTNEITLNVRPTLSRVTKFITDPGFQIGKANAAAQLPSGSPIITTLNSVDSKIPQLEVRQLDSILKVQSGQVMVIGGLLEDQFSTSDAGVPVAKDIPYVGNLFTSKDKTNTKKELVIFIRATNVPTSGNSQPADQQIYNKFTNDPRPLDF